MKDLLICMRTHDMLDFVIDSYQAAKHYTSDRSEVVFAADGPSQFAGKLTQLFGRDRVYVSNVRWGWGAGLFSLLLESYLYFRTKYEFNHFMSIDYDTLFINSDADASILDKITDDNIGLLGCHRKNNEHWQSVYRKTKVSFNRTFGNPGPTYTDGEGVQGGAMVMTSSLLSSMETNGMFKDPYMHAKLYTSITDDHLLPIFVRKCGLTIVDISKLAWCYWKIPSDPRGWEKKGVKLFHPTKLVPGNKNRNTEVEIRNYFRRLRGQEDLR